MRTPFAPLDRLRPAAPLMLRLALGVIFFWHGVDKFDTGISNVEGAFDGWGVPVPGLAAPLTAVTEIIAGAMLIIGLATRLAASALAAVMVGSLLFVKLEDGLLGAAELDLALLAGLLALVVTGPGWLSVDEQVGLEPAPARP
ncbi:MAG: DoxX family protein [Ilumatobacter sp.]|uniref:DoxX family protein n=1 Tax=Ilumatobacter sp. TaxID=1967498 RepID=UPI002604332D|nr:DoxX family protein [Ilumatobacter sp.]MDJ0770081.1 DoxX family protein [Ilumatobacter sp.]